MNDNLKIYARKPAKCPQCKHSPVASILYGHPAFDDDFALKMEQGRIALGGCCIAVNPGAALPRWQCSQCKLEMYRRQDVEQAQQEQETR